MELVGAKADRIGHQILHRQAQDALGVAAADPALVGQREPQRHQAPVQERHPDLDAIRHLVAVDVAQEGRQQSLVKPPELHAPQRAPGGWRAGSRSGAQMMRSRRVGQTHDGSSHLKPQTQALA